MVEDSSPRAGGMLLPCSLAFLSSFCVMVVEIVAGRVIARHVGSSLYTWTSVIGVVLAGITIGNLIGGRLADRHAPRRAAAALFVLGSAACFSIPLANYLVGVQGLFGVSRITDWPLRVALHVTAVFLLPSTALGLLGPVLAKMALNQGLATGRTVGNVYAWGALGSIVGTFLSGFLLIQLLGTTSIFFFVGTLLALVGVALAPRALWTNSLALLWGTLILTLGPWAPMPGRLSWAWSVASQRRAETALYEDESCYSYLRVARDSGDATRILYLDNLIHAEWSPEQPGELQYEYEQIYRAATRRYFGGRDGLRAFFIGGGGYVFPRFLLDEWPRSELHVAEIDPRVTLANRLAFGLDSETFRFVKGPLPWSGEAPAPLVFEETAGEPESLEDAWPSAPVVASARPPITVAHVDARNQVEDLVSALDAGEAFTPYQVIYGDAFNDYAVPFHLVTLEFCQKLRRLLDPREGLYLLNVIDIYASAEFLGPMYLTLCEAFPHVYVFASTKGGPNRDPEGRDTFVLLAAQRELDVEDLGDLPGEEFEGSLLGEAEVSHLRESARGLLLTDDYAPVEQLLRLVVRTRELPDGAGDGGVGSREDAEPEEAEPEGEEPSLQEDAGANGETPVQEQAPPHEGTVSGEDGPDGAGAHSLPVKSPAPLGLEAPAERG